MGILRYGRFALALLVCGMLCTPGNAEETRHRSEKAQPKAEKPVPLAPALLLPPATPEQMPARPPRVTLQNNELMILAPNSTLAAILEAVSSKTGVKIEVPPDADERVVGQFGPGPAHDVLDSLLMGCRFNYVILGSEDGNKLGGVLLFPKPGAQEDKPRAEPASQAMTKPGWRSPVHQSQQQEGQVSSSWAGYEAQAAAQDSGADRELHNATNQADRQESVNSQTTATNDKPAQEAATGPVPAAPDSGDLQRTPNVKTTQELLESMYARRRQMIEQQQQSTQQAPPPQN